MEITFSKAISTILQLPLSPAEQLQLFLNWAAAAPEYRHLGIWPKLKGADFVGDILTVQGWCSVALQSVNNRHAALAVELGDCPEIYCVYGVVLLPEASSKSLYASMKDADPDFDTSVFEESTDYDALEALAEHEVVELSHPVWKHFPVPV